MFMYITFLFLGRANDIDFLRQSGECSYCRVVSGIGATIDIQTVNGSSRALRLAIADLTNWHLCVEIKRCRSMISLGLLASQGGDDPMSFSTKASSFEFAFAHGSKACEGACEAGWKQEQKRLAVG
jgi:hypothetical protein